MIATDRSLRELTAQRIQTARQELAERIGQLLSADGTTQPLPGLHLYRHVVPMEQVYSVVEPSLCVVAQGSKEFMVGEHQYRYDPARYLLTTANLPSVGQVIDASPERPFLSLRLELSPRLITSVVTDIGEALPPAWSVDARAIAVSPVDEALLDAVVRLLRLLEAPQDVPMLWPMLMREIVYRLLMGPQRDRLRLLTREAGSRAQIMTVIARLQREFDRSLRIEDLAQDECIGAASSLQSRHGVKSFAIPQAAPVTGGASLVGERRRRCDHGGDSGRLS